MTDCIHGLETDNCELCGAQMRGPSQASGSMAGKAFALVYVPSLREDSFLHLNREGDHWKFRWYSTPDRPAEELAQSGKATTRLVVELSDLEIKHEISYPYSTSPGGVSIKDSVYWFDQIAKANDMHNIGE